MSVFDASRPKRWRGCPVCGAKNKVMMMVMLVELDERGSARFSAGDKPRSIRRSTSYCQEHGEDLFLRGLNLIGKEL